MLFRSPTSSVSALSSIVAKSRQTMQHVLPSPSSNRTCGFPASGFPVDFTKKHTPATLGFAFQYSIYLKGVHLTRIGTFVQAAHFLSHSACPQQGPLAPPCFQGFLTTMGLSDSHLRQISRLFIPGHPSALHLATVGLPGSSVHLSARAFPYHPGAPYRCICPLLPCRFQASPHPAGWPLPSMCNEAETGSLSLRLTRSQSRGSTSFASHLSGGDRPASRDRLPLRRGPPLHGEQAITMANSFQLARRTRLGLAHQITQIRDYQVLSV